jgi:hypothetical protein
MSRGQHPQHEGGDAEGDEPPASGYDEAYGGEEYGGGVYGGAVYGVGGTTYPPAGAAPSPTASGYLVDNVVETGKSGTITGVVLWKGARAPASLPAVAQAGRCGALENATLRVSNGGGLRDAVVFLADVKSGKAAPPSLGGTLELGQCRFAPYVQLAMPIGQVLAVTNRDEGAAAVRLTRRATGVVPGGGEAVVDLALGARGEATLLLDREAAHEATAPGGHPAASAWIIVPPHPYYTLTDAEGRFYLGEVPPGEYTLVVWHPPVVTGLDAKGAPVRTPALETRTRVKVGEHETTTVRLDLK